MTARRKTETPHKLRSDPSVLVIIPRSAGGPMPAWSPATPPGGWTTQAVLAAACEYANEHTDGGAARYQRLVKAAYRDLMRATPATKRLELEERLSGVDVLGEYFGRRDRYPAASASEPDDEPGF